MYNMLFLSLLAMVAFAADISVELKRAESALEISAAESLRAYNESMEKNKKDYINALKDIQNKCMQNKDMENVVALAAKIKEIEGSTITPPQQLSSVETVAPISIDIRKAVTSRGDWSLDSGVLYNTSGGGEISYSMKIPSDGRWFVEVEYASLQQRSMNIHVDSLVVNGALNRITGSWDGTKTLVERIPFDLKRGTRVLRLSCSTVAPHIKRITLIRE